MTSPDDQDFPGHLLHQAALWDNEELLLDLLNGDLISLVNSQDSWGRTPLHAAATTDNSKCLCILLKAGANPNIASGAHDNFKTPLHTSSEHGFLENVQRLVESGSDVSALEGHGWTAIDLSERGGHLSTFEFLKKSADSKEEARDSLHTTLREAATNGDLKTVKHFLKTVAKVEIESIINLTPNGSNTLLFKACESGNKVLVEILLDNGADGRIHPVTKYSPLYIAAYYGHKDVVAVLLKNFPLLVQVPTVEKWLPLHACCINGHVNILELLLTFEYPAEVMQTFRYCSGNLEYEMSFDMNMKDVSGQTALYIACQMGNQRLVDTLLKHRVEFRKIGEKASPVKPLPITPESSQTFVTDSKVISPTNKKRLSEGIQGILNKLSLATNQNLVPAKKPDNLLCPIDINTYCEDFQTALHVCVKQRNHAIASVLLCSKADPNLPIIPCSSSNYTSSPFDQKNREKRRDESSSALIEACSQRDLGMIDLLLKYGARDDDCKAMSYVLKDDIIVGKLLSLRVHQDSEYKINLAHVNDHILKKLKKPLLTSSILPTSSVNINWHNQRLDRLPEQWLISAALKINPRLRLCPKNQNLSLHAITRLDLSLNSIEDVPSTIFSFSSLKYLNLSQNKIKYLNLPEFIGTPWLEEILFQENQLETVPSELFTHFPSLLVLNLSNNKLQSVPPCMWTSPKLQDLNLSLNLLTDLPAVSSLLDVSTFDSLPYVSILPQSPDEDQQPTSPDFIMVDFDGSKGKEAGGDDGNGSAPLMTHHSAWRSNIKVLKNEADKSSLPTQTNCLGTLNLAHNSFHKIPKVLACLGTNLHRLNLSYNNLKYMGHIGEYPLSLRQLDLSHNRMERWFFSPGERRSFKLKCYSNCCFESTSTTCVHKSHLRLDNLKTLILCGNLLKAVNVGPEEPLTVPEDPDALLIGQAGHMSACTDSPLSRKSQGILKNLWYPVVTMLDLAENVLREVTPRIAELGSLSVLNLSGNSDLTELPPEMGLLTRMWNLNTIGCNLQEPLKSMIESKRCKTMDIIGYLKSVLEDAKPYSRMKLMVVGIQGIGKTSLLSQLRQEGSQKIVPQDHWAKRMGAVNKATNPKSGKPISTVGVDIGSWVLDNKSSRNSCANYGPVIFRTWDFGGQKEYYSTHLYFLSRRSLYLVVWNICDGEKGLNEIVQWLVNIQARAPNSPVIIVGTHFDLVSEKFPPGYLDYLQQKIRDKFICISDPEKRGLPRVMYSLEISCKTRHNIRQLCNVIYETAFNLKTTTGKRLLEQKIPSKYIHLEEIVAYLGSERKSRGVDPVVTEQEFKTQVSSWLEKGFGLSFRDDAEIMQACSFLHENGVLLHYEDSTLRDLYFLDPQWLCDMLAHVVTVREINPFAKHGVMKIDDLRHLFKSQSSETTNYVLSLLSKFELAVPWDHVNLLIPSLLPSYEQMKMGQNEVRVRIPVRSRGWALKNKVNRMSRHKSQDTLSLDSSNESSVESEQDAVTPASSEQLYQVLRGNVAPLNRFLLLSYFPSGFWPRLLSRILSDDRIVEIIRNYFKTPPNSEITHEVVKVLDQKAEWCCWQAGMELNYGDILLLRLKEVTGEKPFSFMLRRDDSALCESDLPETELSDEALRTEDGEQVWDVVDLSETALLEIHLPAYTVLVKSILEQSSPETTARKTMKESTLEPCIENLTKLLALTVDHVDTLLEDWYPSIGTRFVHTSEGKYLVTRLIPCPLCFPCEVLCPPEQDGTASTAEKSPSSMYMRSDLVKNLGFSFGSSPRMSSDSGVGHSPNNTRVSSVDSNPDRKKDSDEGASGMLKTRTGFTFDTPKFGSFSDTTYTGINYSGLNFFLKGSPGNRENVSMYSWSVEYCILQSQKHAETVVPLKSTKEARSQNEAAFISVKCPKHGNVTLKDIAPDVLFLDLNHRYLLDNAEVQRSALLGRGAFGFVFSGKLIPRFEVKPLEIAIKMFQPIDPGSDNCEAQTAYKVAKTKWFRAPAQSACRAYVAARGEVRVLYWVAHANVVPFVGLCQSPLSIIMPRAPRGALDTVLSDYRRSGDKVDCETLRITTLQIGKALEYLHYHRIIYRDLKSENVLVWNFPAPFSSKEKSDKVDLKLADYGISRTSFPTGSKGFGGTEGFMAPEIIRYNGEEEYTEKVDVFSFGMLLYEMMSLKQPFDGCENVKESILEGRRPPLTMRDCELYPLYMLDLMVSCWSHIAKDRPTASQVVVIASAPEFTLVRDVVSLGNVTNIVTALGLQYGGEKEIWGSCSTGGIYCLKVQSQTGFNSCHCFEFVPGVVTAMCHVDEFVWMGDTMGKLYVLRISDYSTQVESDMESQVGHCGAVVSIKHIEPVVAVALSSGRLFLCEKSTAHPITELGKSSVIHCLSSRIVDASVFEIWTGERAGRMGIFCIREGTVVSQETIDHYEPVIEAVEVLLLDTHISQEFMFSYVYPGSVIYGWDCNKREMISRLDVGKLLPVKETLEEELNTKPLQVTVLRCSAVDVYIGTNWGFVFLADVKNLRPITSFRPFTEDVRAFCIFRDENAILERSNSQLMTNDSIDPDSISLNSNASGSSVKLNKDKKDEETGSDSRGSSPTPSDNEKPNFGGTAHGAQLIIGVGKGFTSLIDMNLHWTEDRKQKRRAFAILWHLSSSWDNFT